MSSRNRINKSKANPRPQARCGVYLFLVIVALALGLLFVFFFDTEFGDETGGNIFLRSKHKLGWQYEEPDLLDQVEYPVDVIEEIAYSPPVLHAEDGSVIQAPKAPKKPRKKSPNKKKSPLEPYLKKTGAFDIHFIHIPKCGGTSMTAILREVACVIDPTRNRDCCTNPGFCDWHAVRRCHSIRGCVNHDPHRRFVFKPHIPSITILREPFSRLLSAWFYRGHNPNNDFFNVRPEFKEIYEGKRPKVKFEEYIEMPEYQNIQTRMLGADSFPYKNVTVNQQVYNQAVEALDKIFFVGIQEEYAVSVQVMIRELQVPVDEVEITKERDQQSDYLVTYQKAKIKRNKKVIKRISEVNNFDVDLYNLGFVRFCGATRKYPELYRRLKYKTRQSCKVLCNF